MFGDDLARERGSKRTHLFTFPRVDLRAGSGWSGPVISSFSYFSVFFLTILSRQFGTAHYPRPSVETSPGENDQWYTGVHVPFG